MDNMHRLFSRVDGRSSRDSRLANLSCMMMTERALSKGSLHLHCTCFNLFSCVCCFVVWNRKKVTADN